MCVLLIIRLNNKNVRNCADNLFVNHFWTLKPWISTSLTLSSLRVRVGSFSAFGLSIFYSQSLHCVYSAWAKVRTKRYFYGNTHLAGDSFEYHAQPIQILKGRLVALVALLVWGIANSFSPDASIVLLILFYLALPWLLWSNARFDAAMTSYRNVHFSFNSSLQEAYKVILGRGFGAFVAASLYFAAVIFVAQTSVIFAVLLGFAH